MRNYCGDREELPDLATFWNVTTYKRVKVEEVERDDADRLADLLDQHRAAREESI